MEHVEPVIRKLIGSAPPVGAAARARRLERDQERDRGNDREDGRAHDERTDDGPDDGRPHVDVLA
jgi:hypothetical protein